MVRVSRATAVALLILIAGCSFGQKARDNVLLPALRVASSGVYDDAVAGIEALPEEQRGDASAQVGAFFAAFSADPPREEARLMWPAVAALCESGIQARLTSGTIGPAVADSLRERVANFGAGISTYFREES